MHLHVIISCTTEPTFETEPNTPIIIDNASLAEALACGGKPIHDAIAQMDLDLLPDAAKQALIDVAARTEFGAGKAHVVSQIDNLQRSYLLPQAGSPQETGTRDRNYKFTPYTPLETDDTQEKGPLELDESLRKLDSMDTLAAAIATSKEFTQQGLARECGITRAGVSKIQQRLMRLGIIEEVEPLTRPVKFRRTVIFDRYLEGTPSWQQALKLRTLAHKLGTSEAETLDRLFDLGNSAIGDVFLRGASSQDESNNR